MKYSMVIAWSDADQVYVVSFPEWVEMGRSGYRSEADHRAE